MAGSFGNKRNRKGHGHGKRNHRHASGNGLTRYYYGSYQSILRSLRIAGRRPEKMYSSVREAFDAEIRCFLHLIY